MAKCKIIGVTGGIGSGKSAFSGFIESRGIPVFNSDKEAKICIEKEGTLQVQLKGIFGDEVISQNPFFYNVEIVKSKIKDNPELRLALNEAIHPVVAKSYQNWLLKHEDTHTYVAKESALLFELGIYKQVDISVLLVADEQIRLQRFLKRQGAEEAYFYYILSQQWPDDKKIPLADIVIENNEGLDELELKAQHFVQNLLK